MPKARIAVGHGQMREHELEPVMSRFIDGEIDVFVSTTIIENGIDIPNVNTIIVNDADKFGLAQLYQLRGRVGRSNHQAYAFLLYQAHKALSEDAKARLEAIREFTHLGSGLQIAMRDLEIRGAGNLLGAAQSGFIGAVGFETYAQLLAEAIAERKGVAHQREDAREAVIDVKLDAYVPDDYIPQVSQKIAVYQQLAAARTIDAGRRDRRLGARPLRPAAARVRRPGRDHAAAGAGAAGRRDARRHQRAAADARRRQRLPARPRRDSPSSSRSPRTSSASARARSRSTCRRGRRPSSSRRCTRCSKLCSTLASLTGGAA